MLMRLNGKHILFLLADGVELDSYQQLRRAFEQERATLYVTSPSPYLSVESFSQGKRGADILIDLPLDVVDDLSFDALLLPDGPLATQALAEDQRVRQLLKRFQRWGVPMFAIGEADRLLPGRSVHHRFPVVAEGSLLETFMQQVVQVLREGTGGYRASAASSH